MDPAKDHVKLADIEFSCPGGSGVTTTIFPDGSSPFGSVFPITGVTSTTFTIPIGVSTIAHTYVSGGTARRSCNCKRVC